MISEYPHVDPDTIDRVPDVLANPGSLQLDFLDVGFYQHAAGVVHGQVPPYEPPPYYVRFPWIYAHGSTVHFVDPTMDPPWIGQSLYIHGPVDCETAFRTFSPTGLYGNTHLVRCQKIPTTHSCITHVTAFTETFKGCVAATGFSVFDQPAGLWSYVWHPVDLVYPGAEFNIGMMPFLQGVPLYRDEQEITLTTFADWNQPNVATSWVRVRRETNGNMYYSRIGDPLTFVAMPTVDSLNLKQHYEIQNGRATHVDTYVNGSLVGHTPIGSLFLPQPWDGRILRCYLRTTLTYKANYQNIIEPWTQFAVGPAFVYG